MKYINTIQTFNIARNNGLVESIYRSHMQIYVNEYQYVTVDFPDIFSDYGIILGKIGGVCQMTCFINYRVDLRSLD